MAYVNVDSILDSLRGDPRFEALVQKVIGTEGQDRAREPTRIANKVWFLARERGLRPVAPSRCNRPCR